MTRCPIKVGLARTGYADHKYIPLAVPVPVPVPDLIPTPVSCLLPPKKPTCFPGQIPAQISQKLFQSPLQAVKAGTLANLIVESLQIQSRRRLESTHGSSITQHWLSHGHGFNPATFSHWKPNSSRGEGTRSLSCIDTTPPRSPMLFLTKRNSPHSIPKANARTHQSVVIKGLEPHFVRASG
jgi:hypothetical protein